MRSNLAFLRSQIESALAGRIATPFTYRDRKPVEIVSTGIPEIDALAGGLPRGGLTEICAPPCSGGTSLLLSTLAARTSHSEVCVLIDGCDSFDPYSAQAAGVALQQLLWVRCRNIDQAFRATDLLIQAGGFGLIALDLSGIPPETVRHVPLNVWFRFRRSVEDTPSSLVILEQESNAKTCASLVLQLAMGRVHWSTTLDKQAANPFQHSPACLLDGYEIHAGILRSRMKGATFELNVSELNRSELNTGTSSELFPSQSPVLPWRSPDRAVVTLESLSFADRNAIFIPRSIWSFPATGEPGQENDNC